MTGGATDELSVASRAIDSEEVGQLETAIEVLSNKEGESMITAGIDVGNMTTKVVILSNGSLSYSIIPTEDESKVVADQALRKALESAGLAREAIDSIVTTGVGGTGLDFASGYVTDVSCAVRGATWLFPSVRTVVDMGAESCIVAKCDQEGALLDYQTNQKCASGTGMFLEVVADALEVAIEDIGELSLESMKEVAITASCAVFAESEVISRVYAGESKADILNGIHNSIAARTSSMLQSIGMEKDVVMVGGVARDVGMIQALERQINADILVPEAPQIVAALGAALAAKDRKGKES